MRNDQKKHQYVKKILDFYLALPESPLRFSRLDRDLAARLYDKKVKAKDLEAAMILATARRLIRREDAPSLGPIRSLHYFLPVLEEVTEEPLCKEYLEYLRHKVEEKIRGGQRNHRQEI